jgi:hypothetical protein
MSTRKFPLFRVKLFCHYCSDILIYRKWGGGGGLKTLSLKTSKEGLTAFLYLRTWHVFSHGTCHNVCTVLATWQLKSLKIWPRPTCKKV